MDEYKGQVDIASRLGLRIFQHARDSARTPGAAEAHEARVP